MPHSDASRRYSASDSSERTHASFDGVQIEDSKQEGSTFDPAFLVQFEEGDPLNPMNMPLWKKSYITAFGGIMVLNATFASSAPSGILQQLIEDYHMSTVISVLTISLFVAGYCVGPLLWGPLSEQYGRRPIFIISITCYVAFQVGGALARNTASILVFRFLAGAFAACPLTNTGALMADLWDAKARGKALALFTVMPFAGPSLGPTVAGFLNVAGISWRWTFWLIAMFAGFCLTVTVLTIPETYHPLLLTRKAEQKRKETGDHRWWAPMEQHKTSLYQQIKHILTRPFRMLFLEPMLLASTVYISFVYGCLYLLFEAYPIVFTEGHHFNTGISGLMFLPIMSGGALAVTVYVLILNPRYEQSVAKFAPYPVPPEERLIITLYAAPIFALSFFWFAWTSFPSIPFWAPMFAGLPMGFAISWLFLGFINYIIDTYLPHAASALAANTVARSCFGAGFPLFANQMYHKLGPRWASTTLGFIALAMVPIPFVFIKYGPALRKNSRYILPMPHAEVENNNLERNSDASADPEAEKKPR